MTKDMTAREFCKNLCDLSNSLGGCSRITNMKLFNLIRKAMYKKEETYDDSLWQYKNVLREGLDHLTMLLHNELNSLDKIDEDLISFPIWFDDEIEITNIGYGLHTVVYVDKENGPELVQILDKYEILNYYRAKMKDLIYSQGGASPKIPNLTNN